jgi:NADH-quinone oxidoreductase subunit H
MLAFVAVPFSSSWVIADLEMGIFYLLAVESFVVVGIVMSGWASNNKWSLLGGMRSAAQIISYEVPVSLTILLIILMTGEMSVQGIIKAQGFWPWQWHIFQTPFTFVAFFVFFIGALAEGNRTPFDIPEAESELVSGFNTEYSGFRFSLFFMAEFANIYLMSAIATILFLGGWQAEPVLALLGLQDAVWAMNASGTFWKNVIELLFFVGKSFVLCFLVIQLRWTVPRVRIDQLMGLCWKYLVPAAFVNLIVMSLWITLEPHMPEIVPTAVAVLMSLGGLALLIYFFYRVYRNLQESGAEITFNPLS